MENVAFCSYRLVVGKVTAVHTAGHTVSYSTSSSLFIVAFRGAVEVCLTQAAAKVQGGRNPAASQLRPPLQQTVDEDLLEFQHHLAHPSLTSHQHQAQQQLLQPSGVGGDDR